MLALGVNFQNIYGVHTVESLEMLYLLALNIKTHEKIVLKECLSDSVTNYNYVGDTYVSVSIKKTNATKCTLSEIVLTEILKSFSAF